MLDKIKMLTYNKDLGIAFCLILILGVMIIPIPPLLLDLFLALTMSLGIIILLVSIYSKKPLDFSAFPSVLLLATFLRLSLNVASTRNILLNAGDDGVEAAGEIIRSFGTFVVGGNYAVGIIIFIILVIINFIVITKGAGRVAEVAARFTLDAMPGKQMAIDADLNAGLINEKQAKERRDEIARESDFYGAMDGASKFVRGDAIAGILITIINIIGGIIVGMAQNGLSFSQATEVFTLLTVGDGLVSQIPAIVISIAAGILITRDASDDSLGEQMSGQLSVHPKAIYITAAVLIFFSMIPGLPKLPFILVGGGIGIIGFRVDRAQQLEVELAKKIEDEGDTKSEAETIEDLLSLEQIELEVGYGLVNLVDAEQNGDLLERITHIRKQFALDWGVIVPSIRIKDNLELQPGGYSLKIKGIQIAVGELLPDHFLAMDPGSAIERIEGIDTTEPVFGLPAVWIGEDQRDDAQYNGYTVVDNSTIIATHITEVLKNNLHELFGRQELVRVLDNLKERYPKTVTDLIPDILPLGTVLKVLKNLLKEGVSIRDLRSILEALADTGSTIKDPDFLTESARHALYRTITEKVKSASGDVAYFGLDRTIEEMISKNLVDTEEGQKVSLAPTVVQNILSSINEKMEQATELGESMVILCNPFVRPFFKKLTEKMIPNLTVVSHNEISPEAKFRSLGTVRL